MMKRGYAQAVTVVTLVLVTVSIGVITYLALSPYINFSSGSSGGSAEVPLVSIENYELKGGRLTVYLSNHGSGAVTITEALVETPKGRTVKVRTYSVKSKRITTPEKSIEVWGGDVWSISTGGQVSLLSREAYLTQELSTDTTELWGGDIWGVKDSDIYLESRASPREVVIASTSSEVDIWGGDVWELLGGTLVRVTKGLILYDELTNLNTHVWITRHNSKAEQYLVYTSSGYLVAKVKSLRYNSWAVAGVSSRNTVNLPSSYVIEVEIYKYGKAKWRYAVSMYITSSNTSPNPYYDTPWFAIKLYPRLYRGNWRTYAQLVYRSTSITYRDIRSYSGNIYPHVHVLAKVGSNEVTAWLWDNVRDASPDVSGRRYNIPTLSGSKYVFLVVENPTTYLDEGRFGYVKIYRSSSFTIKGLQSGWWVEVRVGQNICRVMAEGSEVVIDPLNPPQQCEFLKREYLRHGYPIKAEMRVFRYASTKLKVEDLYPGWNVTIAKDGHVCRVSVPSGSSSIEFDFSNPPQGCEWLKDKYITKGFPIEAELRVEKWVTTEFTVKLSDVDSSKLSRWVLRIGTDFGSCTIPSKSVTTLINMSDPSTCNCLNQYLTEYGMPVRMRISAEVDFTESTSTVTIPEGGVAKVVIELPDDGTGPYRIKLLSREGTIVVLTIWRHS